MSYYQLQSYGNRYEYKSKTEIDTYVEDIWLQQNISSDHPDLKSFIKRHHSQIVEECSADIECFNKEVLKISNSYQNNKHNPTQVFDLKLSSVGGNFKENYTSHFVVSYNSKLENHEKKTSQLNNNKSKDTVTFLCQCIFKNWNICNILKIINNNQCKLQCKYLNDDTKKEYSIMKITNAFDIFTNDSEYEKQEYIKHIRNCQWKKTNPFSLFLYTIQMQNTKKFLTNILNNNISQTEEMKASQFNENNNSNNSNNQPLKRQYTSNDNNENIQFTNDLNEFEPALKKRKLSQSQYIPVITDDDYHIKIETPGANNMSISQDIKCKHEPDPEPEPGMPFFNWEADIERDYNNNETQTIPLQLTPIQSIIIFKSTEQCKGDLKINPNQYIMHKSNIIKSIQQIGSNNFEWQEPNDSQYSAITKSTVNHLGLIHGPPGTGKTTTCAQLINNIMNNNIFKSTNKKIFVCAYTHNAINALLTKIIEFDLPEYTILRLGDKDRCPKKFRKYCFEQRMCQYKPRNQNETEEAWQNIFTQAKVIIGTVYSSRSKEIIWLLDKYNNKIFDYLLIDECTQILDPVLTIAVNLLDHKSNSHLILIGDHKQLPPVIKSDKIKQLGYKTIFETLVEQIDNKSQCQYYQMLQMQYRMPQCLMQFSNKEWYENKIESMQKNVDFNDDILKYINNIVLNLKNVRVYYNKNVPIYVINLANGGEIKVNTSWQNENEAQFICQYLLENLIRKSDISTGIISFYKKQAQFINYLMNRSGMKNKCCDIVSQTVDSFQGKEKDLIILSLVRNVIKNNNNFNNDSKRINVALTRCKKALMVVTSFDVSKAHMGNNNIWGKFFKQFDYGCNNNLNIIPKQEINYNIKVVVNDINMINNNNNNRNNNVANVNMRNENQQEVWDFLEEIDCTEYYNIFIENGFDKMDDVLEITIDHLKEIGVTKLGHQIRITKAAKKVMGVIF